jgi:phage/plasmid-associated DNA primase
VKRDPIAAHLVPRWLAHACELADANHECAGRLYDSWRDYAKRRGAEPGSPAEFAEQMEGRGHTVDRLPGDRRRIRWGLQLRAAGGRVES